MANDGKAEKQAAFMFFAFSTVFLVFSLGAYSHLASMPEYRSTITANERNKTIQDSSEGGDGWGLISGTARNPQLDEDWAQIVRMAKINAPVNIGVAFTFISTLVIQLCCCTG
jgi:equilibrative nucleoside transporter 1/2/3